MDGLKTPPLSNPNPNPNPNPGSERGRDAGLRCVTLDLVRRRAGGPENHVLRGIDAHFLNGRCALVTGDTGSGKTSLVHVLAGLLRPTRGTLMADGEPVSRWITPHLDRWRRGVGIVFQHPRLFSDLTVLENVILPMIPRGYGIDELRETGRHSLDMLEMGHAAGESVVELSGGERQRVSLARALVARPVILLADEPTAHQDRGGVERVLGALRSASGRGGVVVVASHDPRVADAGFADDRYRLEAGRLMAAP